MPHPGFRVYGEPKGLYALRACYKEALQAGGLYYSRRMQGLYRDNGKEHGNYYIKGLHWSYIRILEKKLKLM